ncbi:MAG TPA: hypothetical protein VN213_17810 [Solirubrobacteraceae bacterium]|nr:hypothetical protein [Solirubrobacteraceae bacterium]
MEREPDFDEQDSGVPVTPPDRNPDPAGPEHSAPPAGEGDREPGSGGSPADLVREERASETGSDPDEEPARSTEGGPAVPDRSGGLAESDPAQGL